MDIDLSNQNGYIKALDVIIQEFERQNIVPLKKISNDLAEYSALNNDFPGLYLSVMVYGLHKTLTQSHLVESKTWKKDKDTILTFFDKLKNQNKGSLQNDLKNFTRLFEKTNSELNNYFKAIEKKGRVKVGARLYSMSFSTKRVQELLYVNLYDLQNYIASSQMQNQKAKENVLAKKVDLLVKENRNLIFDSSALISIGNTGLVSFFEEFKKRNPSINLYMTESVYKETIEIQEKVVRYGWIGIQYAYLIKTGVFTLIKNEELPKNGTIEEICNTAFETKHGKLELLQKGELDCVIFAKMKNAVLVIDEIVTRWLIEDPIKIHDLMESRYKEKVTYDKQKLNLIRATLKNIPVVRSVDFMAFAIKQGYFKKFENFDYMRPLLYSIKYSGCATTYEEIDNYVNKFGVNKNVKTRF